MWQAPAALPAAVAFPASVAAPLVVLDAACLDAQTRMEPDQSPPPAEAPRAPRGSGRAAAPSVRSLNTVAERSAGPATTSPRPSAAYDAGDSTGSAPAGSAGIVGPRRCRELVSLRRRSRLGEHYRALAAGCDGSTLTAAGAATADNAWGRPKLTTVQGHSRVGDTEPCIPGVGPGTAQPEVLAATPAAMLRCAAHLGPAAESSALGRGTPACGTNSSEAARPLAAHARPEDCAFDDTADDVGMEAAACTWASGDPPAAADSDAVLTCAPAAGSSEASTPVSTVGQGWEAEDGKSTNDVSVCSDLEGMAVVDEGSCSHGGVPGCLGSGNLATLDLAESSPRQPCAADLASQRSPAAGAPGIAAELLPCGSADGSPVSTGAETLESACAATRRPAPLDVDSAWAAPEHASASPRALQLLDSAPSPCALEAHVVRVGAHGGPQGAPGSVLEGGPGCTAGAGAGSFGWAAEGARQQAADEGGYVCADLASAEGEGAGSLAAHGLDACAPAAATTGQQAGGDTNRAWAALAIADGEMIDLPDPGADACALAAATAPSQPGGGDERAWADTSSISRGSAGRSGTGGMSVGSSRSSAAGASRRGDACADSSGVSAESLPEQPANHPWPPACAAPVHDKLKSISGDSWPPDAHVGAPNRSAVCTSADMRGTGCARGPEPGAGEQENRAGLSSLACSSGAAQERREVNLEGQRRDWGALAELPLLRQPLRQSNPARYQNPSPALSPPAVPACAAPAMAGSCRASASSAGHALTDHPPSPAAAAPSLPGPAWELGSETRSCMQRCVCTAEDRYSGAEGMDSGEPAALHEPPLLCVPAGSMEVEASAGGEGERADGPPCMSGLVSCDKPKAESEEVSCMAEPMERPAHSGPHVSQADAPDSSGQASRCCAAAEQPDQAPLLTERTAHGSGPDYQGESRRGRMRMLAAARRRAGRPALLADESCRGEAWVDQGAAGVASHTEQCRHGDPAACINSATESCSGDLASAAGAPAAAQASAPEQAAPGAGMPSEGGLDERSCSAASASDDSWRGCEAGADAAELSSPRVMCAALDSEVAAPAAGSQAGGTAAAHVPSAPACGQMGLVPADCGRSSVEAPSVACGGAVLAGGGGSSLHAQPYAVAEAAWSGACSGGSLHAVPGGSAGVAGSSSASASQDTAAGSASGGAGRSHMVFDPILELYFDAASGQVFEESAVKQMC